VVIYICNKCFVISYKNIGYQIFTEDRICEFLENFTSRIGLEL